MQQNWPMIGRDRDITEVIGLLNDRDVCGIALTDKAGVGRSASSAKS
jgi:hypothetical protein